MKFRADAEKKTANNLGDWPAFSAPGVPNRTNSGTKERRHYVSTPSRLVGWPRPAQMPAGLDGVISAEAAGQLRGHAMIRC